MDTLELRAKRANIFEQMKALHDAAGKENRGLTAEEQQQWDRMDADLNSLKAQIDREERLSAVGGDLAAHQPRVGGRGGQAGAGNVDPQEAAYRAAFWAYVRGGMEELPSEQRQLLRARYQQAPQEARAMSAQQGAAGGYLIEGEAMRPLQEALLQWGGIRQAPTTKLRTTTGADLPIPKSNDSSNKGRRLGEGQAATSATNPTIAQTILRAYVYTSDIVRVPIPLLQDSAFNLEVWLPNALGVRLGRIFNDEDTTGTGNAMPFGIVTGATLGKTAAAAAAIVWTELVELEHSVDPAYRMMPSAGWMFHDTVLKELKMLKDGESRPLFQPGLAYGAPDRILNYPYWINQSMASSLAASAKTVLFGDMANFWVRDVADVQIMRLVERYAEYNEVAFLAFARHDAALVDAGTHPIKYLAQAAA